MKQTSDRRARKALVPLATLLVAGAIAVGSGATFTSTSSNAGNSYATGTLTQTNSEDGAIFEGSNLKPGDSVTGTVEITNDGSLPANFKLTESAVTNTFVEKAKLTMVVTDDDAKTVYSGQFGGMTPAVDLGRFEPAEARTFTFVVKLGLDATNTEQGKSAGATYTWDSVQVDDGQAYTSN